MGQEPGLVLRISQENASYASRALWATVELGQIAIPCIRSGASAWCFGEFLPVLRGHALFARRVVCHCAMTTISPTIPN